MTTPAHHPWRRATAALLALLMALGPGTPALAAITDLADEPVAFVPQAAPNIVMSVDDSTSMLSDFLPDYVIGTVPNTAVPGFCRDGFGTMNLACGFQGSPTSPQYIYHQTNIPFPTYADGNPPNDGISFPLINYTASSLPSGALNMWPAPVHSNALNRLYYDPSITYRPPIDAAGNPLPNQTVFTAVSADPWATEQKIVNLTSVVNVGLWCNSDWPLDTIWDPALGGGNHCRINGVNYDQAFHVPQTKADYQYPWRTVTAVNDVKFFWRNGNQNTLWCDTTSPKYPQNCSITSYKCNTGTYVPPTKYPQSCNFQSNRMGCNPATPTDYTPAGCNTNPAYGPPGPCTKGAECLTCSCNNTAVIGKNAICKATKAGDPSSNANCGCNNAPIGTPCSLGACADYVPPGTPGTCSDGSPVQPVYTCSPAAANCGTSLIDPVTKNPTGVTLYQDSQTTGEVCRHNNWGYPDGTVANAFNYSGGHPKYKTAVFGTAAQGCPTAPANVTRPRHYWKTSVEWCTTRISVATNDKWRGFGLAGTCQDDRDSTHPYPRYYKYGVAKTDPAYADNYTYPAFEIVWLTPAAAPFVHTFQRAGSTVTISRTYIEEMTNYANWFAYYRTRIQAAKTVISQNFSFLDDQFRVGFHTLSNVPNTSWVNVAPFDAAQKNLWYSKLFGIQITMGRDTPIMNAMVRIGELFKNGSSATLLSASDPIVLSCQRNFHMLFTDGIQNQIGLPGVIVNNRDSTISIPTNLPLASPPLMNGMPWPNLYRENTAASVSNTLADYATYYWATDLRGMIDNVITGKDPAPWQHLNFAALSLGTEGFLNAKSTTATEAQITAGTVKWPSPSPSTTQPTFGGVDDLWHAAVNARGRFVNAKTSQELGRGILAILRDLASPKGTDAAAALESPNLSPTNNHVYVASFDGATGNVNKVTIDPSTGASLANVWPGGVAAQLTTQLIPTVGMPDPWNTNRRIVTVNGAGVPVPFQPAFLSPAQLLTLGPDLTTQTNVVEYLRGNPTLEGTDDGQFRQRAGPLGDVVNAAPVLVGAPRWPYQDTNDPGYSGFKATYAARPARVYVGANDGMLHAFDDATGNEAWAYIPRDLFRGTPNDKEGLVGLTYQEGGLPFYEHRYYVNTTPRAIDVDFGGSNWHTILVGGLGKGGQMVYALDITDPATVVDEPSAATKVLWEFRNADLGYTYGAPVVMKTRAFGWTALVPSGYNNASGRAKLFVLRVSDGALLKTLDTGFGTPGSPAGLAHVSGYTTNNKNQLVEQVYGGDLYGNVWRFDLSDANSNNWVVQKFATLTDAGGQPQPITTAPEVEVDTYNGIDRWVFFGTGRLLHVNDLPSTQQQTLYAMRDGSWDAPGPIGVPLTRADLSLVNSAAGLGAGIIAPKGWYDDLPANTRVIRHPEAEIGVVAYTATGLSTDPCLAGQPATLYAREFGNGASVLESSPGVTVESIYIPEGSAGISIVSMHTPGCTDCFDFRLLIPGNDSVLRNYRIRPPGLNNQHRLSWRFLTQ